MNSVFVLEKKDWLTDDQSRPMPCLQSFQPSFSQSKVGFQKNKNLPFLVLFKVIFRKKNRHFSHFSK